MVSTNFSAQVLSLEDSLNPLSCLPWAPQCPPHQIEIFLGSIQLCIHIYCGSMDN